MASAHHPPITGPPARPCGAVGPPARPCGAVGPPARPCGAVGPPARPCGAVGPPARTVPKNARKTIPERFCRAFFGAFLPRSAMIFFDRSGRIDRRSAPGRRPRAGCPAPTGRRQPTRAATGPPIADAPTLRRPADRRRSGRPGGGRAAAQQIGFSGSAAAQQAEVGERALTDGAVRFRCQTPLHMWEGVSPSRRGVSPSRRWSGAPGPTRRGDQSPPDSGRTFPPRTIQPAASARKPRLYR
jgi:hypothetical protein